MLLDVKLPVSIELGRTRMSIGEVLELGSGSIIELDKLAGEPVDILVNGGGALPFRGLRVSGGAGLGKFPLVHVG